MTQSITIEGLDLATIERLNAEARRRGVRLAAIAREALLRGLPLDRSAPSAVVEHDDLDALAGTWSAAEAEGFQAAVTDFGKLDRELWK